MSSISIPNAIINSAALDATEVEENFTEIETFINSDLVKVDGATEMTGALTLVGADPTDGDHAARKSYVDAGDISPPRVGCKIARNATQSIPDTTLTAIVWDAQVSDSDAYFAPSSATVTIPAGRAGLYVVSYNAYWTASPGVPAMTVYVNGILNAAAHQGNAPASLLVTTFTSVLALSVADALTFGVHHTTGGARVLTASLVLSRLSL